MRRRDRKSATADLSDSAQTGQDAPVALDEEQLTTLRSWADGLALDGRVDVRAAAKAILLLVEEVERLHVEVWSAREAATAATVEETAEPTDLRATLRTRLTRLGRGLHPAD